VNITEYGDETKNLKLPSATKESTELILKKKFKAVEIPLYSIHQMIIKMMMKWLKQKFINYLPSRIQKY
jgi:hypothetical protein